jgi:hypothetical protein
MRQPSRAASPNEARNPSPGPRRLMKAPPRATLSPGRGHFNRVSARRCPAPVRQAEIDERSGNVDENKGPLTLAAGGLPTCRSADCPLPMGY